jgi:hypothetical protein
MRQQLSRAALVITVLVVPSVLWASAPADVNRDRSADASDVPCLVGDLFNTAADCASDAPQPLDRLIELAPPASIQAAIDAITDAADGNRYLVRLAPGVWEEEIVLAPYIDIAGSGPGATILRGAGGFSQSGSATVSCADNVSVRELTIDSDASGAQWAVGVECNGTTTQLHGVTISASEAGSSGETVPVYVHGGADVDLQDVTIVAEGPFANRGIWSDGAIVHLRGSRIEASNATIRSWGIDATDGEIELRDVVIETTSDDADGVRASGTAVIEARELAVRANGTGGATGLHARGGSVAVHGGRIVAAPRSTSATATGIEADSEVDLFDVVVIGDGGGSGTGRGVSLGGSTEVVARFSTLEGTTDAARLLFETSILKLGASTVDGGIDLFAGNADLVCFDVTTGAGTEHTCNP